jgi:thioredoxin 1
LFYPEYTITTLDGVTVAEVERDEGRLTTAAPTAAEAGSVPELLVISNGGQEVKLESVVVKGKITIVDFFAEWCGPCRHIGPILETMAGNDPDVVLRKIDIVNWETPVVKQHGIRSVPNVRVFGKDGKQIGQSSSDPSEVAKYIAQAKK